MPGQVCKAAACSGQLSAESEMISQLVLSGIVNDKKDLAEIVEMSQRMIQETHKILKRFSQDR